jgi:phenylacetate-CoA ligase
MSESNLAQCSGGSYAKLLNGVFLPLHSSIKGRKYAQFRRFVEQSQWWTRERLEAFQFEELRKVLRIAFESAPFYQKRYAEAGVRFEDIQTPADLRRLPVLERDDVRRFKEELRSSSYTGKLLSHSTGGSTGVPIQFYRSPESYDWRTAVTDRSYAWAGAILGNRVLYLWGAPTGHPSLWNRTKLNAYRWIRNDFVIDSFHRGPGFWHDVIKTIDAVGPAAIVGYTSNIEELCAFAHEHGLSFPSVKGVVAAAETVYPDLRERVKETFGVPLFNTYGSREFMSIAVECDQGGFHVNMENIYLENEEEGRQSDILVTDLHNYAMPFIRYRIGDTGLLSQDRCICGRGLHSLAALEGKTWDILRTPSGGTIPGIVVRHFMKDVPEVRQYQAEQTDHDRIVLRLALQKPLSRESHEFLTNEFRKSFGAELQLVINEVAEVPRSASGKVRCVIGLPMHKLRPSATVPDVPVMAAQH